MRWLPIKALVVLMTVSALAPSPQVVAGESGPGYTGHTQPSSYIRPENRTARREVHRIRVHNDFDGAIEISTNRGDSWAPIGKVLQPAVKHNPVGYSAARWTENGAVAATASNAIHIKVGERFNDPTLPDGRASLVSLIPRQMFNPPANYGSYKAGGAGIYTNIDSGTYLFSHEWAPFVGDRVYLERWGRLVPLPENYTPLPGDDLVLVVKRPELYPAYVTFENHEGGKVLLAYQAGQTLREKQIGKVWSPVRGIGRFEGSTYPGNSRVRANHNGVIDVATAPAFHGAFGDANDANKGGFQIVPIHHGFQGQNNPKNFTPWMVIAPIDSSEPSPDGMAPLFQGYLRPRYRVEARFKGSEAWGKLPELTGLKLDALAGLTHLRIYFPQEAGEVITLVPAPRFDPVRPGTPATVTGEALPGSRVRIAVGGGVPTMVYATADGRFQATLNLAPGQTLLARAEDPAGRTGPTASITVSNP